jgi:hypothetical protein
MGGEYRTVLQKTSLGGYAESPDQTVGNSGSPLLQKGLSIKDGITGAVAYTYGKQVFNAAYTATVDQIGNARLERALAGATKAGGYLALGLATGGVVAALAVTAEVATASITMAVNNHAINLDNSRIRAERGTRVSFNAGGYYG